MMKRKLSRIFAHAMPFFLFAFSSTAFAQGMFGPDWDGIPSGFSRIERHDMFAGKEHPAYYFGPLYENDEETLLYFFANWFGGQKARGGEISSTRYYLTENQPIIQTTRKGIATMFGKAHFDFPCGDGTFNCSGKGFVGSMYFGPAFRRDLEGRDGLVGQLTAKLGIAPRSRFIHARTSSGFWADEVQTALRPDVQFVMAIPEKESYEMKARIPRKKRHNLISHVSLQFFGDIPIEGNARAWWRGREVVGYAPEKNPYYAIGGRVYFTPIKTESGFLIFHPYGAGGYEWGYDYFVNFGAGFFFLDGIFDIGAVRKIGLRKSKNGLGVLAGVNFFRLFRLAFSR